jgi:hypothetical protein
MAINFPDSPSNGDTVTLGGKTYTYDSASTSWTPSSASGGSSVTVSDTAPTSPSDGDQWFDSADGSLSVYYNDGSSSQWISTSGAAGVAGTDGSSSSPTSYANLAAFPSSGNTAGDMGFATDTKASYMWDGVVWQRLSIGSQIGPRLTTTPSTTHDLNNDGTSATTITMAAVDESGFPITYDWDAYSGSTVYSASSLPAQLTSVTESSGVFSLTGSSVEANAGSFVFRTKASDGVLFTPAITTVSLSFAFASVATGGTITTNGDYKIHVFTSGGTFEVITLGTPSAEGGAPNFDILSIAGGGGGGSGIAGGGGAGGYRESLNHVLSQTSYAITIGAGGAGGSSGQGSAGGNTTFPSFNTTGGGGGGTGQSGTKTGGSGGSGGGSGGSGNANQSGGAGNAGNYTPVEGYDGGSNNNVTTSIASSGGGAGGIGDSTTDASSVNNGGIGRSNSFTGTAVIRGGGGGGGTYYSIGSAGVGGSGGGGNGSFNNSVASNGVVNTGSGGGGGGYQTAQGTGGTGGSGLVIIRYQYQNL